MAEPLGALTVSQAAKLLAVSPQTVRNMITDNRIRGVQLHGEGSKYVVPVEEIDRFLGRSEVSA